MKKNTVDRTSKKQKRNRRASGISWRLFGALAIFVVLVLIVIWLFQVVLLDRFYESSKFDEFADTDKEIFNLIDDEEKMKGTAYMRSAKTDSCF